MKAVLSLILLLVAAACGRGQAPRSRSTDAGPVPGDATATAALDAGSAGAGVFTPVDGSRLKARWMEGPSGARILWGWYDTTVKAPCRFARAGDGELRCLPAGPTIDGLEFADSQCTIPAIARPFRSCETPDAHAVRWDYSDRCGARQRIYKADERITDNRVFERVDGICQLVEQPATSACFRVGEELPPATFVRAAPVAETEGGLLRLVVLQADDGARQDWTWRQHSSDCTPVRLSDQRLHCVPAAASWSATEFSDQGCTMRLASFDATCGARSVVLQNGCAGNVQVLALGPRLEGRFTSTGGACGPAPAQREGIESHAAGGPLADEGFPAFQLVTEQGHRLRRQTIGTDKGRAVSWSWFDGERGLPCFPLLYQGKRRCVPAAYGSFADEYADAACTRPLWRARRDACPVQYVDGIDNRSCPRPRILFSVGAPHTGPVFRLALVRAGNKAGHQCLPAAAGAGDVFHTLVPIADDQLPEVKLVEPF